MQTKNYSGKTKWVRPDTPRAPHKKPSKKRVIGGAILHPDGTAELRATYEAALQHARPGDAVVEALEGDTF